MVKAEAGTFLSKPLVKIDGLFVSGMVSDISVPVPVPVAGPGIDL
jgi:hypothetical protein